MDIQLTSIAVCPVEPGKNILTYRYHKTSVRVQLLEPCARGPTGTPRAVTEYTYRALLRPLSRVPAPVAIPSPLCMFRALLGGSASSLVLYERAVAECFHFLFPRVVHVLHRRHCYHLGRVRNSGRSVACGAAHPTRRAGPAAVAGLCWTTSPWCSAKRQRVLWQVAWRHPRPPSLQRRHRRVALAAPLPRHGR